MKIRELLEAIDIKFSGSGNGSLIFEIPQSRREDLYREIDMVEEVIRLNGYESISEPDHDNIFLDIRDYAGKDYDTSLEYENYLVNRGFKEIVTNSLVDEEDAKLFTDKFVSLLNPSGKTMNVLRPNLMIGALHTACNNFNHGANSLKMYETGNVFYYEGTEDGKSGSITENRNKILIMAGNCDIVFHSEKERQFDVFDMKGELEMLFGKFNIEINKLNDYYYGDYYDSRIEYFNKNILIASIVKFSRGFLKKFDIERSVIVCEIY
jgi:phenylalanyl-tRNA synthetase beta chain